jgi:hypothetical protein
MKRKSIVSSKLVLVLFSASVGLFWTVSPTVVTVTKHVLGVLELHGWINARWG